MREPLGAQAAVFALLLDPDVTVRKAQTAWLQAHAMPAVVRETTRILSDVKRLAPEARLPLVELAAPALCQMTPAQFQDFFQERRSPGSYGPENDPLRVRAPTALDAACCCAFRPYQATGSKVHDD